jgi:hypothetical protein
MTNRFLLFGGQYYYPKQGWRDFRGSFDSLESAETEGALLKSEGDIQWYQVVDLELLVIVIDV